MTYEEALKYLTQDLPMFTYSGAQAYKPGLETSLELAKLYGNPHTKFKSIHIGGTNGKGSTSHMLASVLQQQGYKTALFTSPHLIDFRERMKINGRMIPQEKVIEFVENWLRTSSLISPSFFEFTMMMAFDWFAKEKVDFAIIEVGLGGRLDSTNIITPVLSVITNISLDHTQILGSTIPEIAREKAGIIKKNIPVIIGETHPETVPVFLRKAEELYAPLFFADQLPKCNLSCPLEGDYQQKNLQTLVASIKVLRNSGFVIEEEAVSKGLENICRNTGFIGRWTVFEKNPLVIIDGGHNLAGMESNMAQLKRLLDKSPGSSLHIILGFMADKAVDEIVTLLPSSAKYYAVNALLPRALPATDLAAKISSRQLRVQPFPSLREAFNRAKEEASEKDIIFIGGSLAIVGEFFKSVVPEISGR